VKDQRGQSRLNVRSRNGRVPRIQTTLTPLIVFENQLQLNGPRGSGRVQFRVESFSVITTFAVALPS